MGREEFLARSLPQMLGQVRTFAQVAICDDAKGMLRELYRKIHPDLFHGDEKARNENEKSFKILQEYISAAESDPRDRGGLGTTAYNFRFFLVSQPDTPVELTLMPPSVSSPEKTRKSLNSLFKACGVAGELAFIDPLSQGTAANMPMSLREFIPLVVDKYHVSRSDASSPSVELRALRAALHFNKQLSVVFGTDLTKGKSIPFQLKMLQNLVSIISECPDTLTGLRIGFGTGFAIDRQGTIWLNADASKQQWVQFLQRINIEDCHQILLEKQRLQNLASDVARGLGVASVFTSDEHVRDDTYEQLLQSLLPESRRESSLMDGAFLLPQVCLYIRFPTDDECNSNGEENDVFCENGTITVLSSCSAKHVLTALHTLGDKARLQAMRIKREDETIRALIKQVERKLRLRQVLKDPDLPVHKFKAGCLRLMSNTTELMPLLDGLSIRITETNAFIPGKNYIDVSWSFQP